MEPTNDLEVLTAWHGRTESRSDIISERMCHMLADTVDRDALPRAGDALPPLWHFAAHLTSVPLRDLGCDGHPKRGGFLPPVALPRRMWAGGRFIFSGRIAVGDEVLKTSTVDNIAMKTGSTGTLCFVTVIHELSVDGDVRIREEQDLVYREDPVRGATPPKPKPAPETASWSRIITPSAPMLFRYSALTFNAHRIHYDYNYARDVEGYPALVFQGPLTATLLADLAVAEAGRDLATFSFRAVAPLFGSEAFTLGGTPDATGAQLWAASADGSLAMQASATFVTDPGG